MAWIEDAFGGVVRPHGCTEGVGGTPSRKGGAGHHHGSSPGEEDVAESLSHVQRRTAEVNIALSLPRPLHPVYLVGVLEVGNFGHAA